MLNISLPRPLGFPSEGSCPAELVLLVFPTLRICFHNPPPRPHFWLLPGALLPSLYLECILPLSPAHPCLAFQPRDTTILPSPIA